MARPHPLTGPDPDGRPPSRTAGITPARPVD